MTDNMNEEIILTREGYDKIVAEHEELVSVKRAEVAERIKEAISYGDISENAEYDSAKNEQADLEERIHKLETMIRKARIVQEEDVKGDVVNVGLKVVVKDLDLDIEEEFSIVGTTEADPFEGKISNESAVGHALIGHKKGDKVVVEVPDGFINYEVVEIKKA
jgi:transcription elongation factor GreA